VVSTAQSGLLLSTWDTPKPAAILGAHTPDTAMRRNKPGLPILCAHLRPKRRALQRLCELDCVKIQGEVTTSGLDDYEHKYRQAIDSNFK
jgi:hypothetical protein